MKRCFFIISLLFSSFNLFAQFESVKKAAEEGDISAQMYMGHIYEEGSLSQGINKDIKIAIEWYLKAAMQGNAAAQFKTGFLMVDYYGINESTERVIISLLKESADSGFVQAQVYLGGILTQLLHKFQNIGFDYLMKASEVLESHPGVDYYLAYCYYHGEGTAQDLQKAEEHYQKAADANISEAFLHVAYCAENLRNDYAKAKKYYQKAIDANLPMGYNDMAYLYADGKGVAQDFNEAHRLVDIAISMDRNNYNQQIEFYAKIKTKRQKSPKITKRNGCSKSKHTNHINTQRTQSKQIAFFVSKQIGKVLKCHLKAIIIKNGIKVFMQPYPRINYFAFYTALCLYISRYSSYEH